MADQSTREQLIARLTSYVAPGAHAVVADVEHITACVAEALALVSRAIGENDVPGEIVDLAVIAAGSELFHRRQAPNGISQYAAPDGSAMRIARDPMNAARTVLAPFLPLGLA